MKETISGCHFNGGVDALLALEVLDDQAVVGFGNLYVNAKIES